MGEKVDIQQELFILIRMSLYLLQLVEEVQVIGVLLMLVVIMEADIVVTMNLEYLMAAVVLLIFV